MTDVSRFYHDVIDDVINGVKDDWVEEGLDLQVLDELKKLWKTKLEETHVFDKEPVAPSAAQYFNLMQRSQLQLRPTVPANLHSNVPVRPINPATGRIVVSSAATVPTVFPRGATTNSANTTTTSTTHYGLNMSNALPTAIRPSQPRLPPHQVLHPAGQVNLSMNNTCLPTGQLLNAQHPQMAGAGIQSRPAMLPTALPTGPGTAGAPLAALPSGLTGHLVQIGQQTYLVPQTLVGLRQPDGSQPQLSIPHLVGGAPGAPTVTDPSMFSQTQVDGGHDSDDDFRRDQHGNITNTPSSQQFTPGVHHTNPEGEEEDDDDDDDDFVAATPGFTPSSSRFPSQNRDNLAPDGLGSSHRSAGATPNLLSAPPTPMTPPSVMSHTSFSSTPNWRRPGVAGSRTPVTGNRSGQRNLGTPSRKRRRRSPFHAGDTDTEADEFDDDDEEDVGDEVELMTNATMTPAGRGPELDDDEDEEVVVVDEPGSTPRRGSKASRSGHGMTANATLTPDADKNRSSSPADLTASVDSKGDPDNNPTDDAEEEADDEEPLNSEDDVSDEEPEVLFESDNVVVCQYDKIHRSRNRWRFHLKDGIMAINGRDHVFQKALGEAEW